MPERGKYLLSSNDSHIRIDSTYDDDDNESLVGAESYRSLKSSIFSHRYENGRRYHGYREGHYWAPNDDKQNQHQTISHHLWLLTLNDKLFLAPIQDPQRVIDIGTGTGIWAMDFADQFPDVDVIGTDLSPIQSDVAPPNCHFDIDDCCSPWTYPEDYFDFIHVRLMFGGVADWPAFYKECFEHLKPGAYLEQAELSVTPHSVSGAFPPDSQWIESGELAVLCGEKFGKTLQIKEKMKNFIEEAGFVDVVEKKFIWPIGGWADDKAMKDLGRWNLHHWEEGLEGWTMALLTRVMGWTYDQVQDWNTRMKVTMRDKKIKVYQEVSVVYGRKPE